MLSGGLAVVGLALLLVVAGRGALCLVAPGAARELGGGAGLVAGLLLLHAALVGYHLAGMPWSVPSVLVPLVVAALAGLLPAMRAEPRTPPGTRPRIAWGVAAALALVLGSLPAVLLYGAANPDFVYHWGIKGHRFYLAGGIDLAFLDLPSNWPVHPGYPNLVPGLFAATALVAGGFDDATLPAWSLVFVLALALAAHRALAVARCHRFVVEVGTAAIAAVTVMFAVGHRLAGGADELVALALVVAVAPLTGALPGRAGDVLTALAAALAVSAKSEGLTLALAILAARAFVLWRGKAERWRLRLVACGAPALLLGLPWIAQAAARGWLGSPNMGPLRLSHAPAVLPELGRALLAPSWHGLALAALALLPLLWLDRRLRPLLAVIVAQLLVYALIYLGARQQPELWVRMSFPRLLAHVVPALLVAACLAAERWARSAARTP